LKKNVDDIRVENVSDTAVITTILEEKSSKIIETNSNGNSNGNSNVNSDL